MRSFSSHFHNIVNIFNDSLITHSRSECGVSTAFAFHFDCHHCRAAKAGKTLFMIIQIICCVPSTILRKKFLGIICRMNTRRLLLVGSLFVSSSYYQFCMLEMAFPEKLRHTTHSTFNLSSSRLPLLPCPQQSSSFSCIFINSILKNTLLFLSMDAN